MECFCPTLPRSRRTPRAAPRSMALRALLRGPRNRLGRLLLSSAQLRQPLLRPDIDCRHSPSTEAISNTMKSAIETALHLVLHWRWGWEYRPGIPWESSRQRLCRSPAWCQERGRTAFKSAFGYYLGGLWPIVPGLGRYIGQSATILIPLAIWVLAAIMLSVPWTIAATSDRFQCVWRAPLALVATVIPPLGIIGVASPLTAAGYLFPGTAWVGLAAVALMPGIILSTQRWPSAVGVSRCLVIALCIGLASRRPAVPSGRYCTSSRMDRRQHQFRRRFAALPGFRGGAIHPAESG